MAYGHDILNRFELGHLNDSSFDDTFDNLGSKFSISDNLKDEAL